ncbi:transposase [Sphingopyxis macrogoltabida]|nr:transposase [Sphingopyxis macrogoltabida]
MGHAPPRNTPSPTPEITPRARTLTSTAEACRRIAVSEQTYYRWRKEYGGLKTDQARRMKDLEKENQRLRRAISDLTLDKLILQEAARGNF